MPSKAGRTFSRTASEVSANRADVPGVTSERTFSMNASSIPTSLRAPARVPVPAPIATPSSGTKKSSPNSRPQKAPPRAPIPVRLLSWRVLGFFLSSGHDTVAASCSLMSSSLTSVRRVSTAPSAPSAVSNFQTVRVAMVFLSVVPGGSLSRPARPGVIPAG